METEWLWGRRVVSEALRGSNRDVGEIWIEDGPASEPLDRIAGLARQRGVDVRRVDKKELAGLELPGAQRVAACCGPFRYATEDELPAAPPGTSSVLVVLDHLEDPQNTGAILRTAEVAGCAGVCIPKRRAAQITPAVTRASAGATEHLKVFRIGNVANLVGTLQEAGYWAVALDGASDERWDAVNYKGHIVLVVGAEGKGVQRLVRERCDFRVALPLRGRVQSLNASAAFAAVMFEVVRQQGG